MVQCQEVSRAHLSPVRSLPFPNSFFSASLASPHLTCITGDPRGRLFAAGREEKTRLIHSCKPANPQSPPTRKAPTARPYPGGGKQRSEKSKSKTVTVAELAASSGTYLAFPLRILTDIGTLAHWPSQPRSPWGAEHARFSWNNARCQVVLCSNSKVVVFFTPFMIPAKCACVLPGLVCLLAPPLSPPDPMLWAMNIHNTQTHWKSALFLAVSSLSCFHCRCLCHFLSPFLSFPSVCR